MNQAYATHPIVLRIIIILYLLIFLTALCASGYFLKGIVDIKPIPMIGLLKYILLTVLFLVLTVITAKAFPLKSEQIYRLKESTKNFKWLFIIAIVISSAAKLGSFNIAANKPVQVTFIQIIILIVLAIFCFWSDSVLKREMDSLEETGKI